MMNCQQATRLLSESQDRPLSLKERAALKFHVMMCSGCKNFSNQMFDIRDLARTYAKEAEQADEKPSEHDQ